MGFEVSAMELYDPPDPFNNLVSGIYDKASKKTNKSSQNNTTHSSVHHSNRSATSMSSYQYVTPKVESFEARVRAETAMLMRPTYKHSANASASYDTATAGPPPPPKDKLIAKLEEVLALEEEVRVMQEAHNAARKESKQAKRLQKALKYANVERQPVWTQPWERTTSPVPTRETLPCDASSPNISSVHPDTTMASNSDPFAYEFRRKPRLESLSKEGLERLVARLHKEPQSHVPMKKIPRPGDGKKADLSTFARRMYYNRTPQKLPSPGCVEVGRMVVPHERRPNARTLTDDEIREVGQRLCTEEVKRRRAKAEKKLKQFMK